MKQLLIALLLVVGISATALAQDGEAHEKHLKTMITNYLEMSKALSSDDFETAKKYAEALQKEVMAQKPEEMKRDGKRMGKMMKDHDHKGEKSEKGEKGKREKMQEKMQMGEKHGKMMAAVTKAANAKDINELRAQLKPISDHLIEVAKSHGYDEALYVQFCPMADNNKGAYWLSTSKDILNPYFGSKMLTCGTVKETIGKDADSHMHKD